jgi:hypothetical protein
MGVDRPWCWPRIDARSAAAFFVVLVAVGVAQGSAMQIAVAGASGMTRSTLPLVWHVTGALAAWLARPIVVTAALNARIGEVPLARLEPGAHGDGVLVLHDGTAVPLSRTCRPEFLRRFAGGDST